MSIAIEALILGVGIGLILGLTGAGGGILAVPALVLGLGWTLSAAAPVALFAVGGAAAIGGYHGIKKRQVRYRAAMVMAAVGCIAAPFGVVLAGIVPRRELTWLFSFVMVMVAIRMLAGTLSSALKQDGTNDRPAVLCRINPATGRLRWTTACALTVGSIGALAGLCSGLLGVGGGFVIVPAMARFSDVKAHQIIATSLLAIALIAVSSIASALIKGAVLDSIGLLFIAGSLAGMIAGRAVGAALPARHLLRGFALLMLVVATMLAMSVRR
jgi:uncharacterized membrane protein YfcA